MSDFSRPDSSEPPAGLSWESGPRGRGIRGALLTCRDVLIRPSESLHQTHLSGELWNAFAYYLGMMMVAITLSSLMSRLFSPDPEQMREVIEAMTRAYPPEVAEGMLRWTELAARPPLLWTLTASFIFLTVYIFAGAALLHVCLMLARASDGGFEATFKALAYTHGATAPFLLVPFCGGVIKLLWLSVVLVVALVEWHRTSTIRVLIALTLPLVPFACCFAAVFAYLLAMLSGSYPSY